MKYFSCCLLLLFCFGLIAQSTVDTVGTYLELKLYTGTEDTVYVEHPRYYGHFTLDTCTVENHGTTITGIQGCWQRLHSNYEPRFWGFNRPAPDQQIGTVLREVDAINSAAIAAFQAGGDTILIDSIYPIDRSVYLLTCNTYLGTSDSAGFRRITPPKTVLTDTAFLGNNQIKVEDNTGFRTRQKINIADGQAFDSLAGFVAYTASVAPQLGGDSIIFLSGLTIQRTMQPGDSVGLFFPMMSARFNSLDSIHLKNIILDGNSPEYQLNYDWRVSPTIQMGTTNYSLIEDCRFYNIPNENIFLCGATLRNCTGNTLNGSVVHFSCNTFDRPTEITYNDFSSVNQVGNVLMNHSEAAFTFSAKVQNLYLSYNTIQLGKAYGVGFFRNDDRDNEITDNLLLTDSSEVIFQIGYLYPESNTIYNNKNPNYSDTLTTSCWLNTPQLNSPNACQGNSTWDTPLQLGDTLRITIDSLQLRNSNENFVKAITPSYDDRYFSLDTLFLTTPPLSPAHQWRYTTVPDGTSSLVFDNGHRDGLWANGNWGYECCQRTGGCTQLTLQWVVNALPDTVTAVACPLQAVDISYDGQLATWQETPVCKTSSLSFDLNLGSPILAGDTTLTTTIYRSKAPNVVLFPNPTQQAVKVIPQPPHGTRYQLIDHYGKVLLPETYFEQSINLTTIPNGLYFLQLNYPNGQLVKLRLVKISP